MIASIGNISSFEGLDSKLDYHFSKMEAGVAAIIEENMFLPEGQESRKNVKEAFKELIDLNSRIKNIGYDISLNLPKNESLNDEMFKVITRDYLQKMGYDNTCYIAFRHEDKEHSHVHILLPSVDYDGKKLNDSNNFYRSQEASRQIELKYNLGVTTYNKGVSSESLNSINSRKYYFNNALKKGLNSYDTRKEIELIIGNENLLNKIKEGDFTNNELEKMLGEKHDQVNQVLTKKGMFNKIFKEELTGKLDYILKNSKDYKEYIDKLKLNGIYARKICVKGKDTMVYGIEGVYFKDNSMSARFRYSNLFKNENNSVKVEGIETKGEKSAIRDNAMIVLSGSKSFDEFKEKLEGRGIEVITHENSGGVYGISFKVDGGGEVYKGSDLSRNLSLSNIMEMIDKNIESSKTDNFEEFIPEQKREEFERLPDVFMGGKKQKDDEEDLKKKKKKRKGRNL